MSKKLLNCLLLHGFGGQPFELKELRDYLEKQNIKTKLPCLPGHGLTLEDFNRTRYKDWLLAAKQEFQSLKTGSTPTIIIGFSMGGTLALNIAQELAVDGLVIIAGPVFLTRIFPPLYSDWRLFFVPFLKHIKPIFPVNPPHPESRQIAPWKGYENFIPLYPLDSFLKGMRKVKTRLKYITCPFQGIYSTEDKTVPVENAFYILKKINSNKKELHFITIKENITSKHLLPTHQETKHIVFQKITNFIQQNYLL
ncbi:alpha/beta hydrolase [Desulfonauticus submarinus]